MSVTTDASKHLLWHCSGRWWDFLFRREYTVFFNFHSNIRTTNRDTGLFMISNLHISRMGEQKSIDSLPLSFFCSASMSQCKILTIYYTNKWTIYYNNKWTIYYNNKWTIYYTNKWIRVSLKTSKLILQARCHRVHALLLLSFYFCIGKHLRNHFNTIRCFQLQLLKLEINLIIFNISIESSSIRRNDLRFCLVTNYEDG